MARGPKKTPDSLKVVKGTARKDRLNPDQPAADSNEARPPYWLNQDAVQHFRTINGRLETLGLASATHTETMAAAAMRMAEIERLTKDIEVCGYTFQTEATNGAPTVKGNPAVAMRSEALRHLHSLLAEMGLTPTSIGKLVVPKQDKQENPWAKFG